jgi:hypothetical protein
MSMNNRSGAITLNNKIVAGIKNMIFFLMSLWQGDGVFKRKTPSPCHKLWKVSALVYSIYKVAVKRVKRDLIHSEKRPNTMPKET